MLPHPPPPTRSDTLFPSTTLFRPELTSGATIMLITPSARTVGVKARLTPNGFHSMVSAWLLPPPPPPLPDWTTGTGNSPPARKLAVSPDRSEEHTSELQSLMRISSAVFGLTKTKNQITTTAY